MNGLNGVQCHLNDKLCCAATMKQDMYINPLMLTAAKSSLTQSETYVNENIINNSPSNTW